LLPAGCGEDFNISEPDGLPFLRAHAHCRTVPIGNVYEKIRLHAAGISCSKAVELFEVGRAQSEEAAQTGRFEVLLEPGHGLNWTCALLPRSSHPVFERCHRRGHYFTIERQVIPGR
jgi:hypothetical protein